MGLFPLLATLNTNGGTNRVSVEMTRQLQAMNVLFSNASSEVECEYFLQSVSSWVVGVTGGGGQRRTRDDGEIYLLHLRIEPVRCEEFFPNYDGNVTSSFCRSINTTSFASGDNENETEGVNELCEIWSKADNMTTSQLAELADVRVGAIGIEVFSKNSTLSTNEGDVSTTFRVSAKFNQTYSIAPA